MSWLGVPKAIRTHLLEVMAIRTALGGANGRIHYQEIPQSSDLPHVYFARNGYQRERCVDGEEMLTIHRYAMEIVADKDAEELVDEIITSLYAFEGDVDGFDVQLVEVDDADDDYVFQSIGESEPLYTYALQIVVYGCEQ